MGPSLSLACQKKDLSADTKMKYVQRHFSRSNQNPASEYAIFAAIELIL